MTNITRIRPEWKVELATQVTRGEAQPGTHTCDRRFLQEVRRLQVLRAFQIHEAIPIEIEAADGFGALFRMRYAPWGRSPTIEEWTTVDRLIHDISSKLSEPQKKKFAQSLALSFIGYWPMFLLALACFCILATIFSLKSVQGSNGQPLALDFIMRQKIFDDTSYDFVSLVAYYFLWVFSTGCIGAVASIAMNALSALNDITFDMSNKSPIYFRVVLGGLFAVILSLPLGSESWIAFCYHFVTGLTLKTETATQLPGSFAQASALILPFMLGFSTALVILVLNPLISGLQVFFGNRLGVAPEQAGQNSPMRAAETGPRSTAGTAT